MKLTTPKSILMGAIIIALAIAFRVDKDISIVKEASAEVAGMDSYELRYDYDFKRAVRYLVEECEVTGYVDDGYLYSGDISC